VLVDVDVVGVGVGVFVFGRATKTNTHSQSRCFLLLFFCPALSSAPQPLSATLLISFSSLFHLNPNAVMGDSHQHAFPSFHGDYGFWIPSTPHI